jgi:hypothetical protein
MLIENNTGQWLWQQGFDTAVYGKYKQDCRIWQAELLYLAFLWK